MTAAARSMGNPCPATTAGWTGRIRPYATRVVQDRPQKLRRSSGTRTAVRRRGDAFDASAVGSLLKSRAHVGMAQEKEGVGTYRDCRHQILPTIKRATTPLQLMAVAEHPYYRIVRLPCVEFLRPIALRHAGELKELIFQTHELDWR